MSNRSDPAANAVAITPSDSTELAPAISALYVGVTGDVKVTTVNGQAVTFTGALAGSILPVRCKLVWSTGTTATNLTGLY